MLRKLQRSQCEGFPPELPGEAAAGEGLAAVAGPSPALCQPRTGLRNWGPAPPQLLRSGADPLEQYQDFNGISRINLSAARASCRLMPFGRVAPSVTPCGRTSRPQRVKSLRSKVEFNLAAIPPHRSREESRLPCSGRPGHGRPGRWRRLYQSVPGL